MRAPETLDRGVCRTGDHDPDLWIEPETALTAIALCGGCPAVHDCLDFSTDPRSAEITLSGVWGGAGANRRARMRNARALNLGIDDRYQPVTIPAPRAAAE